MRIPKFNTQLTLFGVLHSKSESEVQQIIITNYLSIFVIIMSVFGMTLNYSEQYSTAFFSHFSMFCLQIIILTLQKYRHYLTARILFAFVPQILFILIPYFFNSNEPNFPYFYVLLLASLLPPVLFSCKEDSFWLITGIAYNFAFILGYDTLLGMASSPNVHFTTWNFDWLRYKLRQSMLFALMSSAYFIKIRLSQYFEDKLQLANEVLNEKNKQINDIVESIQVQNEELQAQQEEMRAQNDDLNLKQQEIIDKNARIALHTQKLMKLAKSKFLKRGDLKNALIEICKTGSITLPIERVSIWEYDWKKSSIICQHLHDSNSEVNSIGIELLAKDFYPYFEAISSEEIIVANNAWEHPATACFSKDYLDVYHIYSMLDAPFFINGEMRGVVCFETVGYFKTWSTEDIAFVKSIADLISLSYEASDRKKAEDRIRVQKEEIMAKNEALIIQQEKIKTINENLEKKVTERTELLEKKNSQLQEYTYVNSHLLRGPLCRILGIIYLVENDMIEDTNIDFVQHLKESATELDEMVKKITTNLEQEHPISAEDILVHSSLNKN